MTDAIAAMRLVVATLAARLRSRLDMRSDTGATAVEYGLMVGLIAAVLVAAVAVLGGQLRGAFCSVVSALNIVSPGSCG